jgi:Tim17/Tim22/Tim23/Pmp24 family
MTSNMSSSSSDNENSSNDDLGAPLPNFGSARSIQLQTIAPALGVPQAQLGLPGQHAATPDYLDYDPKGRGIVTMFANAGCAYLLGITGGGMYGFKSGLQATPSTRFRVQLNSVLNHCGRYGSRAGNTMGVFAVLYSFYEGMADQVRTRTTNSTRHGWCCPALSLYISCFVYSF